MLFMIKIQGIVFGEIAYLKNLIFLLSVKFLHDYGISNLISIKFMDLKKT